MEFGLGNFLGAFIIFFGIVMDLFFIVRLLLALWII